MVYLEFSNSLKKEKLKDFIFINFMDQRESAKHPKYIRESFYAREVKEQKEA